MNRNSHHKGISEIKEFKLSHLVCKNIFTLDGDQMNLITL